MPLADHTAPCSHITVAQSQVGKVSLCPECAVVHLAVAHLTLRLTPDVFCALEQLLTQARSLLNLVPASDTASTVVSPTNVRIH